MKNFMIWHVPPMVVGCAFVYATTALLSPGAAVAGMAIACVLLGFAAWRLSL